MLAILAALLLGASGCGAQAASWTGLTITDSTLYVADLQQVVALNAEDGELLWAFPQDPSEDNRGTFYAAPAVNRTHVVAASQVPPRGFFSQGGNVVWGLDAETGQELWHFDGAKGQYNEGGVISGDTVVIGNSDGDIYALDVESGSLEWQFPTGHRVWASPLIISDTVYIGSLDRHLYALRLEDGTQIWRFPTDSADAQGAFADAPAFRDGVLYIGAFDNRLYAIDAETGSERWYFPPDEPGETWFWGSPATYGDTVYAADADGNVYALSAETGEMLWHKALGDPVRAGVAITEDGTKLLAAGESGTLYALDTTDGFELWSVESEGRMPSNLVMSDEVVYGSLIQAPFHVRALYVENGRQVWAYPVVEEE